MSSAWSPVSWKHSPDLSWLSPIQSSSGGARAIRGIAGIDERPRCSWRRADPSAAGACLARAGGTNRSSSCSRAEHRSPADQGMPCTLRELLQLGVEPGSSVRKRALASQRRQAGPRHGRDRSQRTTARETDRLTGRSRAWARSPRARPNGLERPRTGVEPSGGDPRGDSRRSPEIGAGEAAHNGAPDQQPRSEMNQEPGAKLAPQSDGLRGEPNARASSSPNCRPVRDGRPTRSSSRACRSNRSSSSRQQCLYLRPLPQAQGAFRAVFAINQTVGAGADGPSAGGPARYSSRPVQPCPGATLSSGSTRP